MSTESRSSKRVTCEIVSQMDPSGSGGSSRMFDPAVIKDISADGIKLITHKHISTHRKILVRFLIPHHRPVEINVQVVCTREIPSVKKYEIGCRFFTLKDRERVQSFIRAI